MTSIDIQNEDMIKKRKSQKPVSKFNSTMQGGGSPTKVDVMRTSYQHLRESMMAKIKVSSQNPGLRTNEGIRYRANTLERVMEAMKSHELCESSPTELYKGTTHEKIMNLRPRDKSMEINGDFKFKPRSTFERFTDKATVNATNAIKTDEMFSKHLYPKKKESTVIGRLKIDQSSAGGLDSAQSAMSQSKIPGHRKKSKLINQSQANDSIIMESIQESEKITDGHATARINNSSIIGGDSLMTKTNYGGKIIMGNRVVAPRDMFP